MISFYATVINKIRSVQNLTDKLATTIIIGNFTHTTQKYGFWLYQ